MTTPVTATGQIVARVNDLSGNGHNAYQGTQAYTPTYQQTSSGIPYLKYDLNNDFYNVDFPNGLTNAHYFFATPNGVVHGKITVPAGTWQHPTNPSYLPDGGREIGMLVYDGSLTQAQIDNIKNYFIDRGSQGNFAGVTDMSTWVKARNDLTELNLNDWDISSVTNFEHFAWNCPNLTVLDVSNWDTSSVKSFSHFADRCSSLTTLDVSNWNTSSVTIFAGFVEDCHNLTTLDVSSWDTSSVINFSYFVGGCSSLTTLDVSSWDTSNVINFKHFINGCSSLATLDVSNWNTSSVTDFNHFAWGCNSLTTLDVSNWNTSNVTDFGYFANLCSSLTTLTVTGGTGNPFADSPCTQYHYAFSGTNLTQTSIDNILTAINTAGTSNGRFDQSGGSAPTVTNQINGMLSRGWNVNVTGGYDPTVNIVDAASQTLMGTFTRSSTATYFDSTGTLQTAAADTPRWDYDPATGTLKGLLIEGSRTNTLLDNRDLSTSNWTKDSSVTVTQNSVGIDGQSNTAWTIDKTSTSYHSIKQSIAVPNDSKPTTVSFFIKKTTNATTGPELYVYFSGGTSGAQCVVGLNTNTGQTGLIGGSGSITVENKSIFWRVIITLSNNTSGNTTLNLSIDPARVSNSNLTTLDSSITGSIVYDYGQIEVGSNFPSSPIATSSSSVTRAADNAEITNVSQFDQSVGTFIASFEVPFLKENYTADARILGTNGGIYNNFFNIYRRNNYGIDTYNGSRNLSNTNNSALISDGESAKAGISYNGNAVSITAKGASVVSDNNGMGGTYSTMYIGEQRNAKYSLFGYIDSLIYEPYAMTDQTLQKNTT